MSDGGVTSPASRKTPEMRYAALGSRARAAGGAPRFEAGFGSERAPVGTEAGGELERDRRGQVLIRKADTGRDYRPAPARLVQGPLAPDRPGGVEIPNLDRLAAQVYGRIKRQLAVERERRSFVR